MIQFVSDLRQVDGFLRVLRFPPPTKLTAMLLITDILLKVTLNTITLKAYRLSELIFFILKVANIRFDFDFWCFNATFNNISAISWRPVLVVEEAEYAERTTDHGQATGKR